MLANVFLNLFLFSSLIGDVITTYICLSNNFVEINPISYWLIKSNLFVIVKFILFLIGFILLQKSLKYSKKDRNIIVFGIVFVIGINFVAFINNTIGLIINT